MREELGIASLGHRKKILFAWNKKFGCDGSSGSGNDSNNISHFDDPDVVAIAVPGSSGHTATDDTSITPELIHEYDNVGEGKGKEKITQQEEREEKLKEREMDNDAPADHAITQQQQQPASPSRSAVAEALLKGGTEQLSWRRIKSTYQCTDDSSTTPDTNSPADSSSNTNGT